MHYRTIAIRVLILSLGIAALAGVAVLILPSASLIIAKLIGTAIATAVTAAVLLLSIKAIEENQFRFFGSFLGILACCIYVCVVGAMWSDSIASLKAIDIPEKLAVTAAATSGCGLLMLLGALCMSNKKMYVAGITFLLLWLLILTAWLVNNWIFHFNSAINQNFIFLIVPIQNYSPVFAILLLHNNMLYKISGLLFAIVSCVIVQSALITTSGHIEETPTFFIIALVTAWVCSEMAIWNIITFRNVKFSLPKCEIATAILIGLAFASFCLLIWFEAESGSKQQTPELLIRVSTSFGILASTAFLGLIIGRYFRAQSFLMRRSGTLQATCPRCTATIELPQGKSKCLTCGLGFTLHMEALCCRRCQYDLSGSSNSDVCPECGEPIATQRALE